MKDIRYVGWDVDSEKILVAVAEPGGEVRALGAIPYREESVRRLIRKLGPAKRLRVCYEAGPHGYGLYWLLTKLGVHCDVVAPTLVPVKSGDRVKTNRRDAEKLARCYRSGDLTAVWVPDAAHEALRDLVRAREVAKKDQLRARHRLGKFLLRRGLRAAEGVKNWTLKHLLWIKTLRFERPEQEATFLDYLHEVEHQAERVKRLDLAIDQAIESAPVEMRALIVALQALRGIQTVSAATLVAEVGPVSRFARPKQLMGYSGMVSSENSTGTSVRRGAITKTGNAHVRRILGEAAWAYQYRPAMSPELKKRQEGLSEEVKEIAWKAQHRLCSRYRRLTAKGKLRQKVMTAIGRELLGFIWAIGIQVEKELSHRKRPEKAA
ncbi:MAG TPA: IS110 family transposase [Vicinamibacteria bacterium]|jgi:transposase|nr:IS110 family transposase [Vicinamibacteria bacterium]